MQIPTIEKTDHIARNSSCEIIQEIFGLGANSFLRENDEDLFEKIVRKYRKHSTARGNRESVRETNDEENIELLIRRTLFLRRMDLAIGSGPLSRKKSLLSTNARPVSGTVDKGAPDSVAGNRKIRLA